MSTKGIPHMPGGKANQIERRAKKHANPRGDLCTDIRKGIAYFWSKRPHLTPDNSYFSK